ncbi:MAG: DUF6340 family protein [Bacteroidales bacterium]
MKRIFNFKWVILSLLLSVLTSCGPTVRFFNIDEKVPAKYPVNFDNKSISVFVSLATRELSEKQMFLNDSLQMLNLGTAIAASLEKQLYLDEGGVFVFNHYPEKDFKYDPGYIMSLANKSNSDIIITIDTLEVLKTSVLNNVSADYASKYKSSYLLAPIRTVVNVYDGITTERIQRIDIRDTVYWEILSRNDVREQAIKYKAAESLKNVSLTLGEDIAAKMFPEWITIQRSLFTLPGPGWSKAYNLSSEFKWTEAMDIWLEEIKVKDPVVSSVAAYNIAVACELTDRVELAVKWVDISMKYYKLPGIQSYKLKLLAKLEKR